MLHKINSSPAIFKRKLDTNRSGRPTIYKWEAQGVAEIFFKGEGVLYFELQLQSKSSCCLYNSNWSKGRPILKLGASPLCFRHWRELFTQDCRVFFLGMILVLLWIHELIVRTCSMFILVVDERPPWTPVTRSVDNIFNVPWFTPFFDTI